MLEQLLIGPNLGQNEIPSFKFQILLGPQGQRTTIRGLDQERARTVGRRETPIGSGGGQESDVDYSREIDGPFRVWVMRWVRGL